MDNKLRRKMMDLAMRHCARSTYLDAEKSFMQGTTCMYDELAPLVEWVSVEDRLPEEERIYLVKKENNGIALIYFKNGKFVSSWHIWKVTHWRRIEL
jgi:hypothetical protein